jgi:DNA-binding SARP family transcriptional activator
MFPMLELRRRPSSSSSSGNGERRRTIASPQSGPLIDLGCRSVSIDLLDGFELRCDGLSVEVTSMTQRLIAYLALQSRPLRRLHVAGSLWLDATEDHANASLRSALWRIRQLGYPIIIATPSHVALAPEVQVDFRQVTAAARLLIDPAGSADRLGLDPSWFTGDLLPDWYDEWVVIERERFRQLRLHGLESLAHRLAAVGRFAEAVEAGLAAVAAEPLRESAQRTLIQAHLAEGNWSEARRQLASFRALLRAELGIEPSPELLRLVRPRSPVTSSR